MTDDLNLPQLHALAELATTTVRQRADVGIIGIATRLCEERGLAIAVIPRPGVG